MQAALQQFREGNLRAALQQAGERLREAPEDSRLRTFLFELLCFAGEWTRAEQQLGILAAQSASAATGAALLGSLLEVHQQREEAMAGRRAQEIRARPSVQTVRINGELEGTYADEDERIGGGLEVYGARGYEVLAWTELRSITTTVPKTLRSLLWQPAELLRCEGAEAERVFLPALAPGTSEHAEDAVRLGRVSITAEMPDGHVVPFGAKLLLCEEHAIPLLDVRSLDVIA